MPCHEMHPIQDLFLEGFSYVLQIDMHFLCTTMLTKFYPCKKWVLQAGNPRPQYVQARSQTCPVKTVLTVLETSKIAQKIDIQRIFL
jgi:hypothetical protein